MYIVTVSEHWQVTVFFATIALNKNVCRLIIIKYKFNFEQRKYLDH